MLSIQTLNSAIKTDADTVRNLASNIAGRDVEGFTQKNIEKKTNYSGVSLSVSTTIPQRQINTLLQEETRAQNSILSEHQALHDYMQNINHMFGQKGALSNFANDISEVANVFNDLGANASPINKTQAINKVGQMVLTLNEMTQQIADMRAQADEEISTLIAESNQILIDIANLNGKIKNLYFSNQDATNFEDQRDLLIHKLTGNINVDSTITQDYKISLTTLQGTVLVQDLSPGSFAYTRSPSAPPGYALSPVTLNGHDITNQITGGRLKGLLDARDTVLPNLQAQLDEYTRNLRDNVNAIHNLGTSSSPIQTVTGTIGVPGLGGGPLTAATVISGAGTLRLASLTSQGAIAGYTDITLAPNTTIGNLITQINGATFSAGGVPVPVTAALTADGRLQLSTVAGNGVSIGGGGQVSLGATFNAGASYGFSHFFGLNNLLQTGPNLASPTPQVGITNQLRIRSDIAANANYLACGVLSQQIPPSYIAEGGLGFADTSLATQLANFLKTGNITFAPAGTLPQKVTNLIDYAAEVLAFTQSLINTNQATLEQKEVIYDNFAQLSNAYSSVDPMEMLTKIMEVSTSQNLTSKALSIILQMIRDLALTLRG